MKAHTESIVQESVTIPDKSLAFIIIAFFGGKSKG